MYSIKNLVSLLIFNLSHGNYWQLYCEISSKVEIILFIKLFIFKTIKNYFSGPKSDAGIAPTNMMVAGKKKHFASSHDNDMDKSNRLNSFSSSSNNNLDTKSRSKSSQDNKDEKLKNKDNNDKKDLKHNILKDKDTHSILKLNERYKSKNLDSLKRNAEKNGDSKRSINNISSDSDDDYIQAKKKKIIVIESDESE